MSPLIEAHHLSRTLPATVPVTLVQDVSLRIGSGKSSLLYLLGLLDRPTAGELAIAGRDTAALSERERSELRLTTIGFVFQFHFLLPEFTVRDNVEIPMRKLGRLSRRKPPQAVCVFIGHHDYTANGNLSRAYFDRIKAPATRSPGLKRVASAPVASTTPTRS